MIGALILLLQIYAYVVLASVLLSWIQLGPDNPIRKIVDALVEPVLDPIRKVIPSIGGLDFSPLAVYLGIRLVISLLASRLG